MSSDLPPIPPRPDLTDPAFPTDQWRVVAPGGMSVTAIVGAGLRIWWKNWLRWATATLLFSGIVSVLVAAIDPWTSIYGVRYWFGERPLFLPDPIPDPSPGAVVLVLAGALLLSPWLYLILAKASLESISDGPRRSPLVGRTIRGVRSLLWILFLLVVCLMAVILPLSIVLAGVIRDAPLDDRQAALGFMGLVLLGLIVWLAPRLAILAHVFVAEDARGTRAIGETWRRTRGAWGTAFVVLLLNLLIAIGVVLIPAIWAEEAFPLPIVEDAVPRAIVYALVNALLTPIGIAITAALYVELSARKQVLSRAELRRNLARFDPPPSAGRIAR